MLTRFAALVPTILIAPFLVIVGMSSAANADTPGCVTRAEFRQIQMGMPKPRVERIYDTAGRHTFWPEKRARLYRQCGNLPKDAVNFTYIRYRVASDGRWHVRKKAWTYVCWGICD
jgi:hypothetical protein